MEISFSRLYIVIHLMVVFSLFASPFILFNAYAEEFQNSWKITISQKISEQDEFQSFIPNELPVSFGDKIIWENNDNVIHSITSGVPQHPESSGIFFDVGEIKPGELGTYVLDESEFNGFYYFCEVHPWMTGKIFIDDVMIAQPETEAPIVLEKTDYAFGEKISISGKVHNDFAGTKYTTLIYNQENDLIEIFDGSFDDKASYQRVIETKGNAWSTDGNYQVKLVYAVPSKVAETNFEFSTEFLSEGTTKIIPDWIKNVGNYWCNDQIKDIEFVNAVQFLIKENIIELTNEKTEVFLSNEVPEWVKNSACWWSNNQIPDPDFIYGLEYLVNSGIIRV